jgi:hypothetical protein
MKANSAFTIQQQEILKILGNSELDIDTEMGKLFEANSKEDDQTRPPSDTVVSLKFSLKV